MDKKELRDVVNEVIRASKEEQIPISKLETALINVLEKKLDRKLNEEEVSYIKKSVSREALTEEIEKNCSIGELENVFEKMAENKETTGLIKSKEIQALFRPISAEIDTTPMDLINETFEIADKGLGTYLKEKNPQLQKSECKAFNPLYDELNRISNMFFTGLSETISKTAKERDLNLGSKEKNELKERGKEIVTTTVKTNSENMKKTGNLNPAEEKFIKNISSIINKFIG